MARLNKRAILLFYFGCVYRSLVCSLILLPVAIIVAIPGYIFATLQSAQSLFLQILVGGFSFSVIFLIFFPIIWAYLSYLCYSISTDTQSIEIQQGIIFRRHKSLPYKHISNITILRPPVMAFFGLSELEINQKTADSQKPIKIQGISVELAQFIRNTFLENTLVDKAILKLD